jgi:hypothetical protein
MVVLIFTILSWLRFIGALQSREFLEELAIDPQVPYLVIVGLFWGGVGLILVYGLWWGRRGTPVVLRITTIVYAGYYWMDRLLLANPNVIAARWPFAIGLTFLLIGITIWILSRPIVQQYFRETRKV